MKSVLTSVKPMQCELMARGAQTVMIKKTRPKMKAPFKCYIYCSEPKKKLDWGLCLDEGRVGLLSKSNYPLADRYDLTILSGKVIGEVVCDKIIRFKVFEDDRVQFWNFAEMERSGLTYEEIAEYVGCNNFGYAWHMSDLVIYDKPKELSEFSRHDATYDNAFGWAFEDKPKRVALTRPPQSWCYVESEDKI